MRPSNGRVGVAFSVGRLVAIVADVVGQRIAAANRDGAIANVISQMNDRQLQDVGLSRARVPALKDGFASAEAQLGMVR
jgi:hypothetical protein